MDKIGKFLLAGNWKMNGSPADSAEIDAIINGAGANEERTELLICPPFHLLERFIGTAQGSQLQIGAQDCHFEASGAHTGDISAEHLAALGVRAVICGHSERRAAYGETNAIVRLKAEAAIRAGLHPIICVGETAEQYKQNKTLQILEEQVKESIPAATAPATAGAATAAFTLAYEPIWAIGTGKAARPADVARAHSFILEHVETRILYGGSVNADNAAELAKIKDVNGFLIGSASLKASSFLAIMEQCKTSFL